MLNIILILLGKIVISISKLTNIGSGSTWPGHIALNLNNNFIKEILSNNRNLKTILIAGTNGKTTTSKLTAIILNHYGKKVFQNKAGANLMNGIASSLIENSSLLGSIKFDYGIFEVDENSLPLALENINPAIITLLNLFRDQLDRYGEVNTIADKWKNILKKVQSDTTLILNADDPKIAYLGINRKNTKYFGSMGLNLKKDHASDSTYCPRCGSKLTYSTKTFSHLGNWSCTNCGLKKPKTDVANYKYYPLSGFYNKYNVHAAVLIARTIGVPEKIFFESLKKFKPAFGRQESLKFKQKNIKILLSKNPTSFNQSLDTIIKLKAKHILIILNDRIPDGRDVSWIWDVDFENSINNFKSVYVSGDRVYDMALRLKYSEVQDFNIYEKLKEAINSQLLNVQKNEILYILPTYSAMLDLRKILTGKQII
ncbi:MAG: DUF1727 domain-containing protein [Candidatus Levybacteria bacterium]|nr:DUF1727 domain-containing protein [Candidatus Levybacteria bacterium]